MPTFDPAQFILDYPQFNTLTSTYLTNIIYSASQPFYQFIFEMFTDPNQQYYWSCVVLAHILTLVNPNNVNLIYATGRVINATDGDVSTGLDKINGGYGSEWWLQTRYGFEVWNLMQQYGVSFYVNV